MSTNELLPCPFCGGTALANEDPAGERTVGCEDCPATMRVGLTSECTAEQGVKMWNAREATAPQMADVEDLAFGLLDVLQTVADKYALGVAGMNALRRARDVIAALRTTTLACEQQKQRADEAEKELEQVKLAGVECAVVLAKERDYHERQHLHYQKLWDDLNGKFQDQMTGDQE